MDTKEKERRINNIRLRATILKSIVMDLEKTSGIDMRQEMINFFNDSISVFEEEEGKMKVKVLDENFMEPKDFSSACYGVFENGDIELYTPYDTAYPIITAEEILKLAEIIKEG